MKLSQFNICPSCMHVSTCLLTSQKNQVWSCSEYEELQTQSNSFSTIEAIQKRKNQQQNKMKSNF